MAIPLQSVQMDEYKINNTEFGVQSGGASWQARKSMKKTHISGMK